MGRQQGPYSFAAKESYKDNPQASSLRTSVSRCRRSLHEGFPWLLESHCNPDANETKQVARDGA